MPTYAPPEFSDRQTLWNAVEAVEKNPRAQLAYSFDIALQNELSLEENKELAIRFCKENLLADGMIVDLSLHSPDREVGIENPHFHVLCPMRPLKENGEWGTKQRRVYALDEHGNRIRDCNGKYVFTSENTTDWDSPKTLERWRKAWADLCNSTVVSRIKDGVGKIAEYIGNHKTALAIIAVIALLAVLMLGVASSCSVFVQSGTSGLGMSTYPSKDEDMLSAEASYKSLEEALNQKIADYELTHGYNEYHYNISETGHDPYVLISALTAIHGGEWTVSDVLDLIQTIFEAQYILTENVIVETRYYTEYTTEWQWVWDNYYQQWVQIPVTVEVQVPYDYYICTVTLEVKDLEEVVTSMMTDEQKILFNMYMEMKGNRGDLFE